MQTDLCSATTVSQSTAVSTVLSVCTVQVLFMQNTVQTMMFGCKMQMTPWGQSQGQRPSRPRTMPCYLGQGQGHATLRQRPRPPKFVLGREQSSRTTSLENTQKTLFCVLSFTLFFSPLISVDRFPQIAKTIFRFFKDYISICTYTTFIAHIKCLIHWNWRCDAKYRYRHPEYRHRVDPSLVTTPASAVVLFTSTTTLLVVSRYIVR